MSKKYNTKLFITFNRLHQDFKNGNLTEDQFYKLLGFAISKEFSHMINSEISQIMPSSKRKIARFLSYNWEKSQHAF